MRDMLGSIFLEPWWLDAVAPERWFEASVARDDEEVARMPFVMSKRKGLIRIGMPPITQFVGPYLAPATGGRAKRLANEKRWLTELIDSLPSHDILKLNLDPYLFNGLPFYWKGFDVKVGYTYVLETSEDPDRMWDAVQSNIRTDIKKAERQLVIRDDLGVDALLQHMEMSRRRTNGRLPFDRVCLKRLHVQLEARQSSFLLAAEDTKGRVHAVAYFVWDDNAVHYLAGGADPALRNSGASSLLLWDAIKATGALGRRFNFEGSMVESIERYFRAFGAAQVPYLQVHHRSYRADLINSVGNLMHLLGGKRNALR